jgi:hypothetical protein
MTNSGGWKIGLLALAVLMVQGCTSTGSSGGSMSGGTTDIDQAFSAFQAHLKGCTATYGYDPAASHNLGPYELGPHEREWRNCAYEGIQQTLIPKSSNPEMYYRAISQDQLMTDLIEQKKMTRAERQQRLDQMRTQILGAERTATDARKQRELELTRNTVSMLQGIPGGL